jgi:Ca2+-binding RTX toxin-like protein
VALSASVIDGVLKVEGSTGADAISFSAGDGHGVVVVRGVPGVEDGTPFAGVTRVAVQGRQGNDTITVLGGPRDAAGDLLRFTIQGGNGHDAIQGGPADDDLRGGNGRDTIRGGNGDDAIRGANGHDSLDGESGDDFIEGNYGHDTLLGGPGHDHLRGGSGDDALRGGSGNDLLRGGFARDDVYGGAGVDQIFGDRDRDVLRGLLEEFGDFNREDANGFDVLPTNPDRGTLSDFFWSQLDEIVGEGDLTEDQATATTTLQQLRARSADEGDEFDDEFGDLSAHTRDDIIDDTYDIIDEYLDDMYDNPSDINEFSVEALRRAMEYFFPSSVRGDYNEYMEAFVELDDDLEDFGRALDRIENGGDKDPWFREFEAFFEL